MASPLRTFLARRLLAFIPTLLLILLLVFAILNAVPAMPPANDMPTGEQASQRAAHRVFREQFGLHLPVFLNFRHGLSQSAVADLVRVAAHLDTGAGVAARDRLENLQAWAVPGLVAVASDATAPPDARDLALRMIPEALLTRRLRDLPAAERAVAERENERLRSQALRGPLDDRQRHDLALQWRDWLVAHAQRFQPGVLERVRITLCDTRFATYLARLARLDFGDSMLDHQPVLPTLVRRLKNTLLLTLVAIVGSYLVAVPLGALSARMRGRRLDRAITLVLFGLYSLPSFFVASLLLRFFTLGEPFDWFPIGGLHSLRVFDELSAAAQARDVLHHMVLPVLCMSYGSLAILSRYTRASTLEVLSTDYIRTARAKGLAESAVLFRHALRNSLLPVVTLLGNVLPAAFGGAVIVEFVFDINGMGSFIYQSILLRDHNAVLATALISAVLTLIGYLVSDVLYAVVDPRVALRDGAGR